MKKPALAGYSHVEGRRPGRPLHCDLSPSPPFPRERGNRPENRQSLTGGGKGEGLYSAVLAEAAIIECLCRCRLSNSIIARNKWGRASRPLSMTGRRLPDH